MGSAQDLLDRVQSLARLADLEGAPAAYAEQLATELAPASTIAELEARDAVLTTALGAIDAMIARAMKLRLEHALATDTSLGPPTRTVFAQTVVTYAGKLPVLAQRARDIAARGGARDPDGIADLVTEAARAVLALRDGVRGPVLALVRDLATAAIPDADRRARDRQLDDPVRKRWSAVRRDLEMIAEDPERMLAAPMPARVAAWPEQLDEPAPEREVTRAELLELD